MATLKQFRIYHDPQETKRMFGKFSQISLNKRKTGKPYSVSGLGVVYGYDTLTEATKNFSHRVGLLKKQFPKSKYPKSKYKYFNK